MKPVNMKRPSLEDVLTYQNDAVIANFRKNLALSEEEACEIFEQMKCMLWLINESFAEHRLYDPPLFKVDAALSILDEMWHAFILCSRDYHDFCMDKFGYFLHHQPDLGELRKIEINPQTRELNNTLLTEMRQRCIYVYNKLGKACFLKWYVDYKTQYSAGQIMALKVQAFEQSFAHKI